jgi:RNA polymerase sigma-70 factor (ECF subfamily)
MDPVQIARGTVLLSHARASRKRARLSFARVPLSRRMRFDQIVIGPESTDTELVARCRAGDERAWALLVERYGRYVYAIAGQGFRLSDHDAEDVFQETFARAYERLDQLRDDSAVRPWLAQLARRLCLDRLQRAGRTEPQAEIEPADVDDDTLERLDEAFAVRQCLETLPGACREILDRFFARDESYRTIGDALGLPPGTIASRISRCLAKLRTALEGRPEDVPLSSEQAYR